VYLYLNLVSLKKIIFYGKVKFIKIPGVLGQLQIFPKHTPLLTKINFGIISVLKYNNIFKYIYVSKGIVEIQPLLVTILAKSTLEKSIENRENLQDKKLSIIKKINSAESYLKKIFYIHKLKKINFKLSLFNMVNKLKI